MGVVWPEVQQFKIIVKINVDIFFTFVVISLNYGTYSTIRFFNIFSDLIKDCMSLG